MARHMPYWRVSPKFWPDTASWSEDARTLGIYLLTCEHRTTEGLFVLRPPYIYADLNWPPERLRQPLAELIEEGFIQHDPERAVFLIIHALNYQAPANPNMVKSAIAHLAPVPLSSPLTCTFRRLCEVLCKPLYEQLPEGFGKPPALAPTPPLAETVDIHNPEAPEPDDTPAPISVVKEQINNGRAALRPRKATA